MHALQGIAVGSGGSDLSDVAGDTKALIESELERVKKFISEHGDLTNPFQTTLKSPPPYIPEGGKYLRPRLVLLSAHLCDYRGDWHIPLGCALELLHNSSLFHDDVIDEATTRRGVPSINVSHSNRIAILAGDLLMSRGMSIVVRLGDIRLVSEFVSTLKKMVEGELVEMSMRDLNEFSYEKYLEMIDKKTASLIALCLKTGALVAKKAELENLLEEVGLLAGRVFQISDDLLDYLYSAEVTGKDRFRDYYEGKPTYPAQIVYSACVGDEKEVFLDNFGTLVPQEESNELLERLVKKTMLKEKVEEKLKVEVDRTIELAKKLPRNSYSELLEELTYQMAFRMK